MELSPLCTSADGDGLQAIWMSNVVISLISLFSTLISIFIHFILPNLKKNKALRLIRYLLASNAILSIGSIGILVVLISKIWTNIFFTIYLFGLLSGINLTLVFSLNLYFEVYHKKSLAKFENLMILTCFAIAATSVFLWFLTNQLIIFAIISFIYIISAMTATIWLYIKVILAFNKISYPDAKQCMKDLAIYPLVGMVMMIFFISQQILVFIQHCYSNYYLIFNAIRNLQGFIDVVIYGFNTIVRAEIKKKFQKQQELSINVPISNDSNQDYYHIDEQFNRL